MFQQLHSSSSPEALTPAGDETAERALIHDTLVIPLEWETQANSLPCFSLSEKSEGHG